jgi:hypothetical protein
MNISTLLLLIIPIYGLDIQLQSLRNTTIYSGGEINPLFIYKQKSADCQGNDIYYETSASNSTNFSIVRKGSEEFKPLSISVNNENTRVSYQYNKGIVKIDHICGGKADNFIPDEYTNDYWALVKFEFSDSGKQKSLEFIKICKHEPAYYSIPPAVGMLVLAVLVVSMATRSKMKVHIEELEQVNEIKWWHGLVFVFMGSVMLVTIFYLYKYIESMFTVLIMFQSFICVYFTLDYYVDDKLKGYRSLSTEYCGLPMSKYILAFFTGAIIISWYFTRDWRLNNTIGVCLVFTIVTIFSIKTFRTCWIILVCIFLYDVFWVFFSKFLFKENVMVVSAMAMNVPIKLEMPLFLTNNPIKACTFLGLGDLALPGFVIKYCYNFDRIKLNNRFSYYKLSLFLYTLSLFLAYAVVYIFNHAQPVMFYISPLFSVGLAYFAYKRHEFEEFWIGKDLIGNKVAIEEMINGAFTQQETRDNTLHLENI